MVRRKSLRARLRAKEVIVGTFVIAFPSVAVSRIAADAGADFVLIDGEHTGFGWETMTPVLTAARDSGATPFVRIPAASRENIALALDIGATGLMIPMVGTAEQAAQIASWARYPPQGVRGAMFGLAAHDFQSVDPLAAMKKSNDETIVMVQIETQEGLDNVEEIAAVPGVDILWVGHWDLSISMGIPADFEHPRFIEALQRITAAGAAAGKAVGFLTTGADHAKQLVDDGFRMLAFGSDIGFYRQGITEGMKDVRDRLA